MIVERIGGVMRVVNITTITITENNSSLTTPNPLPTEAKISPTSPLGTIPQPISSLFVPLPATRPDMIFDTIATVATPIAISRMLG